VAAVPVVVAACSLSIELDNESTTLKPLSLVLIFELKQVLVLPHPNIGQVCS